MRTNWGSVPLNSVLPFFFDSYDGATGASEAISGLAVTDIEVYKGTSMTQRSSDSGYTLLDTDGIDLDGMVGINGFSIDTSDNTDAGFYTAGSFYTVVVASITADTQTVNFVAGTFRLTVADNTSGTPVVDVGRVANTTQTAGDIIGDTNDIQSRLPAALVGGRIDANVGAISSDSTAADNLEQAFDDAAGTVPWLGIIDQGTAQAASATGLTLRAAAAFVDDTLIGATVAVLGSTQGYWQTRTITDNELDDDTIVVDAWDVQPSGTITYKIFAVPPASASLLPKVDVDTIKTQTVTAAAGVTFPSSIASPTNITAGTITTTTNLTNAPSDSSGVTTLLSRIGGSITISGGIVSADAKKINGVTITGTGVAGDEFEP